MQAVPQIDAEDVEAALPAIKVIGGPRDGGQKRVFCCDVGGRQWAVKFVALRDWSSDASGDDDQDVEDGPAEDSNLLRLRREVDTMAAADTPHLVRLGPLPLSEAVVGGQRVAYYSEEWIEGTDLRQHLLSNGPLAFSSLVKLGEDVSMAIDALWRQGKIHRDIKPGNIMRREGDGAFVLLDVGLCFDLHDESITRYGVLPGTPGYWAPEQFDLRKKRNLDFRSDQFVLGIVLYELSTGEYPFGRRRAIDELIRSIAEDDPIVPSAHRADLAVRFDTVVMRMLAKQPYMRYRSGALLRAALRQDPLE